MAQGLRTCLPVQGTWFHPWSRRVPHCEVGVVGSNQARGPPLLNLCPEPVRHNQRTHHIKKPARQNDEGPHLPQLEKSHAQQWRPSAVKDNFFF